MFLYSSTVDTFLAGMTVFVHRLVMWHTQGNGLTMEPSAMEVETSTALQMVPKVANIQLHEDFVVHPGMQQRGFCLPFFFSSQTCHRGVNVCPTRYFPSTLFSGHYHKVYKHTLSCQYYCIDEGTAATHETIGLGGCALLSASLCTGHNNSRSACTRPSHSLPSSLPF